MADEMGSVEAARSKKERKRSTKRVGESGKMLACKASDRAALFRERAMQIKLCQSNVTTRDEMRRKREKQLRRDGEGEGEGEKEGKRKSLLQLSIAAVSTCIRRVDVVK